jgi:hypothetical protein
VGLCGFLGDQDGKTRTIPEVNPAGRAGRIGC